MVFVTLWWLWCFLTLRRLSQSPNKTFRPQGQNNLIWFYSTELNSPNNKYLNIMNIICIYLLCISAYWNIIGTVKLKLWFPTFLYLACFIWQWAEWCDGVTQSPRGNYLDLANINHCRRATQQTQLNTNNEQLCRQVNCCPHPIYHRIIKMLILSETIPYLVDIIYSKNCCLDDKGKARQGLPVMPPPLCLQLSSLRRKE